MQQKQMTFSKTAPEAPGTSLRPLQWENSIRARKSFGPEHGLGPEPKARGPGRGARGLGPGAWPGLARLRQALPSLAFRGRALPRLLDLQSWSGALHPALQLSRRVF